MAVCRKLLLQSLVKYNRTLTTFSALRTQTQLTSERYPNLTRGNFAVLDDSDLKHFENILEPGKIIIECAKLILHNYTISWTNTQCFKSY